jgi:hypothetical protein
MNSVAVSLRIRLACCTCAIIGGWLPLGGLAEDATAATAPK